MCKFTQLHYDNQSSTPFVFSQWLATQLTSPFACTHPCIFLYKTYSKPIEAVGGWETSRGEREGCRISPATKKAVTSATSAMRCSPSNKLNCHLNLKRQQSNIHKVNFMLLSVYWENIFQFTKACHFVCIYMKNFQDFSGCHKYLWMCFTLIYTFKCYVL